jgi:hypothetical protein
MGRGPGCSGSASRTRTCAKLTRLSSVGVFSRERCVVDLRFPYACLCHSHAPQLLPQAHLYRYDCRYVAPVHAVTRSIVQCTAGCQGWVFIFFPNVCPPLTRQRTTEDSFNLYGLRNAVQNYKECLDIILDYAPESDPEPEEWSGPLAKHARDLYGLIHARFIITQRGQQLMVRCVSCIVYALCLLLIFAPIEA